jgi:hypothetical protein
MYLFGGAGWYRERTHFRQVSLEYGTVRDPYFCEPGFFPVVTGVQRTTSRWHSSWAQYQRIAEFNNKAQFVPIRVGLRF